MRALWLSLCLLSCLAHAHEGEAWARRWLTVSSIVERHSGYEDGDTLSRPAGTWQLLYGVLRTSHPPNGLAKDCLWVRVPTAVDGELRVVEVPPQESCEGSWGKPAAIEMKNLKALQSRQEGNEAQLWLTQASGRVLSWKVRFLNAVQSSEPQLHDSSVPRRTHPGVFFFEPESELKPSAASELVGELADRYPQHPCKFDDGSCQRCRFGVYAVPEGEKKIFFCGVERCGEKHQPACARGTRWQRTRDPFSCRSDDSYLFCAVGLRVECEGERGICR